jgi:hypothetical protein
MVSDEELKELVFSLAKSQQKTDEQLKKTDEQLKKTDEKLDRLAKLVGSISNNQGDVAEEYFANSIKLDNFLGMSFDVLQKNVIIQPKKGHSEEYDLMLINGENIVIIEVKYKVHKNDVKKLPRKIEILKKSPLYKNYKIYAGIAGFHINKEAKEEALKRGFFVLQRKGDIIQTYAKNLKVS